MHRQAAAMFENDAPVGLKKFVMDDSLKDASGVEISGRDVPLDKLITFTSSKKGQEEEGQEVTRKKSDREILNERGHLFTGPRIFPKEFYNEYDKDGIPEPLPHDK